MDPESCSRVAARLNAACQCVSLDRSRLAAEIEQASPGSFAAVMDGRPHLFSDVMVFIGENDARRMAEIVAAVERVAATPAYREHVLGWAPAAARSERGAKGVFFGYDFHLGEDGPQLIEINTNAGGGLLNAILTRAQIACCDEARERMAAVLPGRLDAETPEQLFVDMFRAEWRAQRGDAPLRRIAIVDDRPDGQYLYPEFVLFQSLFQRHGIEALVCDAGDLMLCHGHLWFEEKQVDLVYNRLTDFSFDAPSHAVLRQAWLDDAAVITPHPRSHALYADKRNLVALSDDALLAGWNIDAATRAVLAGGIPRTEFVTADKADDLWARRRHLFFKPAAGYGSKAAYRGESITKRAFEDVLGGIYVAQARVEPSSRRIEVEGKAVDLKLDLRCYAYEGRIQLVAARLWQGQTTNFRTPGGGFAPVLAVSGEKAATAL